jgi:hypothetical protein
MTMNIVKYIKKYLHDYKNSHSFASGLIKTVTGYRCPENLSDT